MRLGRGSLRDPSRPWLALVVVAGAALLLAQGARLLPDGGGTATLQQRLAASPFDQAALRDLALVEHGAGRTAQADRLAELSGQLGWRDSQTQRLLIDAAIRRGDDVEAMRHVDALLRRKPVLEPALLPVLHAAATGRAGREELLRRLAARPAWRTGFFERMEALPLVVRDAHEALLVDLARQRQLDRDRELVPYVRALATSGEPARARRLWIVLTGAERAAVRDPAFQRLRLEAPGDRVAPFEWTARRRPGVDLRRVAATEGGALSVGVDRSAFGSVLTQQLVLRPGRYRLTSVTPSPSVVRDGALRWTLRCVPGGAMMAMDGAPLPDGWRDDFTISADRCAAQMLSLEARRTDGPSHREARFDRILIAPIAGVR